MARALVSDTGGNAAMIFCLAAFPLMLLTGAGLDFSRAMNDRSAAQHALDAAALAAARAQWTPGVTPTKLQSIATAMFRANLTTDQADRCAAPTLARDEAKGEVRLAARCKIAASLTRLGGSAEIPFEVRATTIYNKITIELALMLDVTGSMAGTKIADLRTSATELIDTLLDPALPADSVRIGLAPFANAVNAGPHYSDLTGMLAVGARCVTERTGAQAFTTAAPGPGARLRRDTTNCPAATVLPLTDDASLLKSRIGALGASGMTAGHLGIAFARYLVAPEWAGVWGPAATPEPYGKANLVKAVVLMTDGEFNIQYAGPGSSEAQARRHCDELRAQNVRVYAVAFMAPPSARALLKHCATNPSDYFTTSTGSELRDAYRRIADDIMALRLSS
jgi:Flp pilus assembly protein TadG